MRTVDLCAPLCVVSGASWEATESESTSHTTLAEAAPAGEGAPPAVSGTRSDVGLHLEASAGESGTSPTLEAAAGEDGTRSELGPHLEATAGESSTSTTLEAVAGH